jgi:hypothetical protein
VIPSVIHIAVVKVPEDVSRGRDSVEPVFVIFVRKLAAVVQRRPVFADLLRVFDNRGIVHQRLAFADAADRTNNNLCAVHFYPFFDLIIASADQKSKQAARSILGFLGGQFRTLAQVFPRERMV